mmetsp:Transcript_1439/g.3156  ORF Transcript_1439/g.3156 Transcript_1439/m.3156 type:complete len:239 (-) Transcript_1439:2066-2782(-)
MSSFVTLRQFETPSTDFVNPYLSRTLPISAAAFETKAMDRLSSWPLPDARAPNIGRICTGCGVGILALGSPIWDQDMAPPFTIISGFAPNMLGFHRTRSASFPTSTLPTCWDIPWVMAGLMVYLAKYRFTRVLSFPLPESSSSAPRWVFILQAVCQVRVITSPTRPMAWLSLEMIEIAPISWRMSSAAIVSARIRLSAKATSSGILESRWWQTISISRCSFMVLTVKGLVGFVEEGRT